MIRYLLYITLIPFLNLHAINALDLECEIKSDSVILINGHTGKVLYQKNAQKLQYPASITKIVTCICALKAKPNALEEKITVQQEAVGSISESEKMRANFSKHPSYVLEANVSSIVGIKRGEILSFRDLLYGMMLASGDDASNVIAQFVGNGSIPAFVDTMNGFVQSIGCKNTHLCNPHGLFHPDQVTTAEDMAKIAQVAMTHPLFREIVKTTRYEKQATNKQPKTTYGQTNKLLKKGAFFYPYAIGIKTGYLSKAKRTLVAASVKDGRYLIAVLLHCPDRNEIFSDAKNLFESAFAETKIKKTVVFEGVQNIERTFEGSDDVLVTYTKEPYVISYYPSELPEFRCHLVWDKINFPIEKGQKVGTLNFVEQQNLLKSVTLYAENDVSEKFLHFLMRKSQELVHILVDSWIWVLSLVTALAFSFFMLRRKQA